MQRDGWNVILIQSIGSLHLYTINHFFTTYRPRPPQPAKSKQAYPAGQGCPG